MKLTTTACAILVGLFTAKANANPLQDRDLKGVYLEHIRTPEEVRKLVVGFFEDLAKKGYTLQYTLEPDRNEATFKGEYKHWLAGTIKLSGPVTWDDKGIRVLVSASKYQGKVEDRIREFLQEALKK